MCSIDDKIAYEAEQQELVDGIVSSLHRAIEDDYQAKFSWIAVGGLDALRTKDCVNELRQGRGENSSLIADRISAFTDNEIERKLLLSQVVRKLLDPVLGQHQSNYLRATIMAEAAAS